MQLLEALAGLDPVLLDEVAAGVAEGLERLGAPPGTVQRQHEVVAQPFADRELRHQRGQVGDQRGVVAEPRLHVGQRLPGLGPPVGEPDPRGVEHRAGEAGKRLAGPPVERPAQQSRRVRQPPFGPGDLPRPYRRGDRRRVEAVRRDGEPVSGVVERQQPAGRPRRAVGLEDPAQPGDVLLHDVDAVLRWALAPDGVDDLPGGHRRVGLEEEHGEHRALLAGAEVELPVVEPRPHRAEDREP